MLLIDIIAFGISFMSVHGCGIYELLVLKPCFEIHQMTQIWTKLDNKGYTKCIERPKNRYSKLIFPSSFKLNISSK
jgi:hypothetical protein